MPGKLTYYIAPGGPHVRVDSACYTNYVIPPHYDSMISKLIVKGKDRQEAIKVGKRALQEFHLRGVPTTIEFHQYMLEDENFLKCEYNLDYIDQLMEQGCTFEIAKEKL